MARGRRNTRACQVRHPFGATVRDSAQHSLVDCSPAVASEATRELGYATRSQRFSIPGSTHHARHRKPQIQNRRRGTPRLLSRSLAPVAQMERASAFEADGRGFESLQARQSRQMSGLIPCAWQRTTLPRWARQTPSTTSRLPDAGRKLVHGQPGETRVDGPSTLVAVARVWPLPDRSGRNAACRSQPCERLWTAKNGPSYCATREWNWI